MSNSDGTNANDVTNNHLKTASLITLIPIVGALLIGLIALIAYAIMSK